MATKPTKLNKTVTTDADVITDPAIVEFVEELAEIYGISGIEDEEIDAIAASMYEDEGDDEDEEDDEVDTFNGLTMADMKQISDSTVRLGFCDPEGHPDSDSLYSYYYECTGEGLYDTRKTLKTGGISYVYNIDPDSPEVDMFPYLKGFDQVWVVEKEKEGFIFYAKKS